uniref:Calponin EH domain binding protein 1 n=1 Tax=Echinococcus granulosus TaxID=6210 RepID=A0A068X2H0_ECHGR|nr:Calponin EH domain binding protein 1 [Echinococcus granulosus]
MSLWKRIQRIGMKAAKFQFTVSLEELSIRFEKGYRPKGVTIVFTRRGRRCTSQPIMLQNSSPEDSSLSYMWAVPDNLEVVTTLYRNEKDISFEDKEWTFQIEDVCMSVAEFKEAAPSATTRRRVLATRSLNLAEFASALPTQNNLKVKLRAASKKVSSATLLFTLHGLMLRSGEATDEDMISVASSMSLTYAPPSAYGSRWSNESPIPESETFYNDVASISNRLKALEHCPDLHEVDEEAAEAEAKKEAAKSMDVGQTEGTRNSQADIDGLGYSSTLPTSQLENQAKVTSQTGQDLLAWCQEVTATYPGVKIKDLTICFRSGLALCAIIHHFQPQAIGDFELVLAMTPTERVRLAFDAASRFGVARVFVDPCEVVRGRGGAPDRLSMMTYLHQLRTCLIATAATAPKEEEEEEEKKKKVAAAAPLDGAADHQQNESEVDKDSVNKSTTKAKNKKQVNSGGSSASERYEQLLTKARTLLTESKSSDKNDSLGATTTITTTDDHAVESPSLATSKHELDGASPTTGNVKARKLKLSNLKLFSDGLETHLSLNASPSKSPKPSTPSNLSAEAAALAAEQEALDCEAPDLERRLRAVMGSGTPEEEILMRRWFQLISRRNALVHRSYQLSIMEKESDLERTTVLLNAELRELMEKDDSQKTAEDRAREELLLREVVEVVNERNEIVQELDYQEQALVNEVELGLQTDAITQQTFRAISGGGDAGMIQSCIIQ